MHRHNFKARLGGSKSTGGFGVPIENKAPHPGNSFKNPAFVNAI